jgi:oligoendopeptidase F
MSDTTYQLGRWSLNDLFASGSASDIETVFTQLEDGVKEIEALRPSLQNSISSADFLHIIRKLEAWQETSSRLYAYVGLSFSADTQDQPVLALMARVEQFLAEMGNRTLFFSLWWKGLPDEVAEHLIKGTGDFSYWLEEMRHFKKYTLSEPEEKIINIKDVTGARAFDRLYDTFTNRYTFKLEVAGEVKELTRGELMVYARHHDPDLRARAYQELYRVYGNDGPILGQIYQTLVRDWRSEGVNLRGYASPISVRNLANDIPDEVVETLLDVCQKNAGIFQRFFRLKARMLGMERLRRYDIYAPISRSDKTFDYQDAVKRVFTSFTQFDPQFSELARRVFDQQHLDSEIRKGKRGGAFCWSCSPGLTPWILLNYQGHSEDVATMAHELGHAIHSMLASEHSIFTFHSSLPLAETASTFGEMMLVDQLLAEETDESVKRDILFRQVDDAYATILRQSFFAIFEKEAHEMVNQNASADDLAAAYQKNLQIQFGDAVEISDEFKWEWVSIPHIYGSPFYVYAYAFGQLLVLSLYKQFKLEGEPFKARYKTILATGGSAAPAQVLARAGIDIRQPAFWQGGFDVIDAMVKQLEAL